MWWRAKTKPETPPTLEQLIEAGQYREAARRLDTLELERVRRAVEDDLDARLRKAGVAPRFGGY